MTNLIMYDSVDVAHLPDGADAYAGYTSGKWPTWAALEKRFEGKAHLLSIAINASEHALCLDVENGDATPAQAPAWVKTEHSRNVARPVVYASVSSMTDVLTELAKAGIKRDQVRVWSAHYGEGQHLCGPDTCKLSPVAMDATQWTDKASGVGGALIDETLLTPGFFAAPAPKPVEEITYAAVRLKDGVTRLVVSTDGGKTMH